MIKDTTQFREELLKHVGSAGPLPMLSNMMNEVFRIMSDPGSSFNQLYDVVKYDQAISSKIISMANSTFYNRGAQVTNLERAMAVVGFKEIERAIMCLVFLKQIMAPWRLGQEDMAAVWEHSLTVAHAAKVLCTKTSVEDPEKAFAISILHDIGKLMFYAHGDGYRNLAHEACHVPQDVCDLERAEYGIDHQELGYHMSVKWKFPKEYSEAILTHHSPHDGKVPIIDIVRDADAFACGRENSVPEGERTVLQHEEESIKAETERIKLLVGV